MSESISGIVRGNDRMLRDEFVGQLEEVCRRLAVDVVWSADRWVAQLITPGRRAFVVGYDFDLNGSAAAQLSIDKAATSETLQSYGVPTVDHILLTTDDGTQLDFRHHLPVGVKFPLVVKPNRGFNGHDVTLTTCRDEFRAAYESLQKKHADVAVSPYIAAAGEYRVIVLDDDVLLTYRKVLTDQGEGEPEWRFNAEFGSTAELVSPDAAAYPALSDLAHRAMRTLGLRLAAVDIMESIEGELSVMEINADFSMNYFSRQSPENRTVVIDLLTTVVASRLRK
ncbi:hypothetical protein ABZ511_06145 [Nocardia gamkensis]|uniref:ATP-grasp domain-containing protein n=1 Tax=Nocardia gamkensis TaxID=352869 RepID=UPI0033D62E68